VLEPGCGPAALADYLSKSVRYCGFDANPHFIAYALRKGNQVRLGNILEPENYRSADVVVICDVLHHLPMTQKQRFIRLCFSHTKRLLVICEPQLKNPHVVGLWRRLNKFLHEWFERDGINHVKLAYTFTPSQARRQIQDGFGVIPTQIKRQTRIIGVDFVVVFSKHD
jgi:SAM-dependent methyltransferase